MKNLLVILLLVFCGAPALAENSVAVERLGEGQLSITFTSTSIFDVQQAQEALAPKAIEYCDGRIPQYGHYKFESTEKIAGESSSGNSFTLVQQVLCLDNEPELEIVKRPVDNATLDREALESQVRSLTESYYQKYFSGEFESAYSYLSETMKSYSSFEDWKTQGESSRADVGEIVIINVHTISIYENPPNAPSPGLYVAADYQNRFEKVPYHCGYVVWFKSASGNFEITREDSGFVTDEILETVQAAERPNLLARMRCSAR